MQAVSGIIVPDGSTIEIGASGSLRVKDAGITPAKMNDSTGFQAAVSKSDNTVYQAATDGFFIGIVDAGGSSGSSGLITGYTDANNPPTTVMGYAGGWRVDATLAQHQASEKNSFCIPVKKGNYYKGVLTTLAGSPTATYYFIPRTS